MKYFRDLLSGWLWRMFWPKKPPAETGIKFGKKDEDGFKEVIRDGKPVGSCTFGTRQRSKNCAP